MRAPDRAVRKVYWSREAEMEAWALEHDTGSVDDLSAAFAERFGFPLSRMQVNQLRARNGTQSRQYRHPKAVPVGTERTSKGYTMVKVAEMPTRPLSKDNWKLKHVWVWEQHNGPLPEGHNVFFADRDRTNFDPDNLVAVPKRLVGPMNENASCRGMVWSDRESLLACMAYAELSIAINDAGETAECAVCGSPFAVDRRRHRMHVCPSCREKGFRPRRDPGTVGLHGSAVCKRCGTEFEKDRVTQVNCPDCVKRDRQRPSRQRLLGKEVN